jgi:hypothetical protein
MKCLQFNKTRFELNVFGLEVSNDFNSIIHALTAEKNTDNRLENDTLAIVEHIYLVNQYLLKKIEKLGVLLHEGFVNQKSEYFESDFTIINTMLDVSIFKITSFPDFQQPLYSSIEELELRLAIQLKNLINLSNAAPANYASNYLTEMKVIPGIKLDIYQLIFFALKHTKHHLNQISTLLKIDHVLEMEKMVN